MSQNLTASLEVSRPSESADMPPATQPVTFPGPLPQEPVGSEFDYKPVPALAPVALVVGLCSIAGYAAPTGLTVSLVGMVLAVAGLMQIRQSGGELGGSKMTWAGLILSLFFLVSGSGLHAYSYATEVPEGYQRVDFYWLAKQEPTVEEGQLKFNKDVSDLDGKKVFIKGYMYPEGQQYGITRFVLCRDNGDCCFGGQPKLSDMIQVQFVEGVTARFREQQLVSVAGVFRARPEVMGGRLVSLYTLEGTYFK